MWQAITAFVIKHLPANTLGLRITAREALSDNIYPEIFPKAIK
jgi:hypothetical protein